MGVLVVENPKSLLCPIDEALGCGVRAHTLITAGTFFAGSSLTMSVDELRVCLA